MIMAEAITIIQTRKNSINHWVLHSVLIVILALELFLGDSQALQCQYFSAIRHFVRVTLFIGVYAPGRKLN